MNALKYTERETHKGGKKKKIFEAEMDINYLRAS